MERNKPVYTADILHTQLRNLRIYKDYRYQAQLSASIHVSRQVYSLWEKGQRKPDISQLVDLANLLEVDINYFFIEDADPRDYDYNIDASHNKFRNTFSIETKNAMKLMPFVETIVSKQLFKILDRCKNKKGIYAINVFEDSGVTRALQHYSMLLPDCIILVNDVPLSKDILEEVGNSLLLVFENADRLTDDAMKNIVESLSREFNGSILLIGKSIKTVLNSMGLLDKISGSYSTDSITTDDFNHITRSALPGVEDNVVNLLRMETGVRLKNLYEVLKKLNDQYARNPEFKVTTESILGL